LQLQTFPLQAADYENGLRYWIKEFYAPYDYGKIISLSVLPYPYENNEPEYKTLYYHSEISSLIGTGIIEGFLFNNGSIPNNEIRITDATTGTPVIGTIVHLLCQNTGELLASTITDSNGFYQFKGLPDGQFQLNIEKSDFIQKNSYDINVSLMQKWFKGRNFVIGKNETSNLEYSNIPVFKLFPNPTTGIIQIEGLLQNKNTTVSIFNVMGQKLEQKEINTKESTIDLSSYKKGTYYFSFNNSIKSAVKIIKE